MGHILIPYKWKELIFSKGLFFFQHSIYSRERSHTPLNPSGRDSDEEEPRDDYTIPQTVHDHSHWKRDQCIHRVISQTEIEYCSQDTLKSNWHSQQQHHEQSLCDDVSTSTRKLVTGQSGISGFRGNTTDDQTSTRKLVRDLEPAVDKKPQFEMLFE